MNGDLMFSKAMDGLYQAEAGWMILKWVYVFMFALYLVFALVVFTQIRQMSGALNGKLDRFIKLVGVVFVGIAVAALVLAIVIL